MCTALDLVREKSDDLASLPPEATALDAANLMNDRHIGSVLVMDGPRLMGIFTERDVLRRIVAAGRDPEITLLRDVMTSPVACAMPHTTLEEMRLVVRNRRVRHLPVVDESGSVMGIVSIGDMNRAEHAVQEQTIHYLEQYISVG
jgi:CBS domain-containing protein